MSATQFDSLRSDVTSINEGLGRLFHLVQVALADGSVRAVSSIAASTAATR